MEHAKDLYSKRKGTKLEGWKEVWWSTRRSSNEVWLSFRRCGALAKRCGGLAKRCGGLCCGLQGGVVVYKEKEVWYLVRRKRCGI